VVCVYYERLVSCACSKSPTSEQDEGGQCLAVWNSDHRHHPPKTIDQVAGLMPLLEARPLPCQLEFRIFD
jgi:hypothetical protein